MATQSPLIGRTPRARTSSAGGWLGLVIAITIFLIGTCTQTALPGIYMDGVNPDYMVVPLANPTAKPIPIWILDGNHAFHLFPILAHIYYGALPFWLGLPAYVIFGTGVIGIRIAHAILALCILAAMWYFFRSTRANGLISTLTICALAADPSFQFAFRNQFYITAFPVSLLLLSIALIQSPAVPSRTRAIASGAVAGLSAYGYFIYYFFVLVAALAQPALRRLALLRPWLMGVAIGLSPVALGCLLFVASHGGPVAAVHAALDLSARLGVMQTDLGLTGRIRFALLLYELTLSDQANTLMMLQTAMPFFGMALKYATLVYIPMTIFLLSEATRRPNRGLRLCFALLLTPLIYTLVFGNRLWAQHFAPALPLFYCFACLAYDHLRRSVSNMPVAILPPYVSAAIGCVLLLVTGANIWNERIVFDRLEVTGGVGLMSDAINRFSEGARSDTSSIYLFPDWGLYMPFVMLTHGAVEVRAEFNAQAIDAALSSGHDVILATIGSGAREHRDVFAKSSSLPAPELSQIAQRDGVPVVFVARWHHRR